MLPADIRSLYPRDWTNFLERMGTIGSAHPKGNLRGIELPAINEEDFCEKGSLAHLAFELQQWAAYRGQQLARTVRGEFQSFSFGLSLKSIRIVCQACLFCLSGMFALSVRLQQWAAYCGHLAALFV